MEAARGLLLTDRRRATGKGASATPGKRC